MKRFVILIMACLLLVVVILASCSQLVKNSKSSALIEYEEFQTELSPIVDQYESLLVKFVTATQNGIDFNLRDVLVEEIIPETQSIHYQLGGLSFKDSRIQDLLLQYTDIVETRLNGFEKMVKGIERHDPYALEAAQRLFEVTSADSEKFLSSLKQVSLEINLEDLAGEPVEMEETKKVKDVENNTKSFAPTDGLDAAYEGEVFNITSDSEKGSKHPISTISLSPRTYGTVHVKAPEGWIESPIEGGNFGGIKLINPNDGNQEMSIIISSCAGCAYSLADTSLPPEPLSLIPEGATDSRVLSSGLSASYTYYTSGNPYSRDGVVIIQPGSGYAIVEIQLPENEKSVASTVLNSFDFNGYK